MRLPIRTSFGCLLDVVSRLDIRCLCFLLDLEPLIDRLKLLHDFLFGDGNLLRDQEVAGSSPVIQTRKSEPFRPGLFSCLDDSRPSVGGLEPFTPAAVAAAPRG